MNAAGTEHKAKFTTDGAVELYYDNAKKLETTADGVTITSTDAGAGTEPLLVLYRDSASPADSDDLGQIVFRGVNDADQDVSYASIFAEALDVSDGTEDGQVKIQVMDGGSLTSHMRIGNDFTVFDSNPIITSGKALFFEGSTTDANETTLTVADPTADRTITLPDATGTVLLNVSEDTTPQLGGVLDTNGNNIEFPDSTGAEVNRIKFGAGDDLQIYHDGSNSYINDTGTGNLNIRANNLHLADGDGTSFLLGTENSDVKLYHNGSSKLETTSGGISVTGEVAATSLDISGDVDVDGTLEADAITLDGTAITTTATLSTGISNNNVPKFTSGVADNDFLRVDGTAIEGRSASQVLSDIEAMPLAGGTFTGDVTLQQSDDGSSEDPQLILNRVSSSPADNDVLGTILFRGRNDAGQVVGYAKISSQIADATDGTEDGFLSLQAADGGSLNNTFLRIGGGEVRLFRDTLFLGDNYTVTWDKSEDTLEFADNAKLAFGAGDDISLHWDGTDGHLAVAGTLNIEGSGETLAKFIDDGAVELYHDNSKKLETASGGISVTGEVAATSLDVDSADIDGGAIDGVTLGTNSAITELQVDNINIDGNSITSTDADGNLALQPNGTGDILLNADTVRVGDSNANAAITTNGTGDLTLNTNSGTNSGSIVIADGANGNISLTPDGTGVVQIDGSNGVSIESGVVAVKNGGTQSEVRLYCESSNQHYAALKAPAHNDFAADVTSTLPSKTGILIGTANADAPATVSSSAEVDHVLVNDGGVLKKATVGNLGISGGGGDVVDDTSPQLGGDLQSNGNDIDLADNDALVIGTGSDTSIKHDGSGTIVNHTGTGKLQFQQGGATKLQLESDGVTITGRTKTDGLMVTSTPIGMSSFNFRYIRITNLSAQPSAATQAPAIRDFRLNTAADGSGTSYPPNMTANNAPSPYVASGNYLYSSSYDYYEAFNSSIHDEWWLLGDSSSNWTSRYLQIDLGSSYNATINRIDVAFGTSTSSTNYIVGSYKILGSNTGAFSGEETTIVDVRADGQTSYQDVTHRSDQFQAMNFEFEGATDDTNELILAVTDPTADRTITLPDATGTVLTTGNSAAPTTTTSPSDADFVLVDDGGTMKKITPANLGIRGSNLLINGAMQLAQRGTSSSVSNNSNEGYQTLDRWQFHYYNNAGGVATISQDTDVPSGEGFSNSYEVNVTTADTSIASTHMISFSQRIEAQDIRNSGWNYTSSSSFLTLSFYIKSTKTGTYCISANLPDVGSTFKFIKEFTISSASTWEYKTIKIPGNASAVIDNDSGRGMDLEFVLQTATDVNNATDNTWHTADGSRSTGNQVNFFDSTSNVLNITGVQLEVGDVATPFEHRSFADELQKCKRYFQTYNEPPARGVTSGSSTDRMAFMLPVTMRAAPSVTFSGTLNWYDGAAVGTITSLSATYTEPHSVEFDASFATGSSSAGRGMVIYNAGDTGTLNMDAEL